MRRRARLLALLALAPALAADAGARSRRSGAPHLAEIDLVALSPDGGAALTRDAQGGVRLWPALDGSVEPVPVSVEAPAKLAIARQGDALIATLIDSAGGARVVSSSSDGALTELASLPPTDPWIELFPIPGARALVGLAADATLRLLSPSGEELARLEERGFAASRICVSSDGKRLLAWDPFGDSLRGATIDAAKRTIALAPEPTKLSVAQGETRASNSACSLDARRWATLVLDPKQGDGAVAHVVDAVDGTVQRHRLPGAAWDSIPIFASHTELVFESIAAGMPSWRVDLDTGRVTARPSRNDVPRFVSAIASAHGRLISVAHGRWLRVEAFDRSATLFLGYDAFLAQAVAISPGTHRDRAVAWLLGTTLFVETLDGRTARAIEIREGLGPQGFTFVDRDHVVLLDGLGTLRLYAWKTGKELHRAEGGVGWAPLAYEPSSRLIRVANGVENRLFDVSVERGFGPPRVIFDGSWASGLLIADEPSDPAFWTFDGGTRRRVYTLEQARRDLTWDEMNAPVEPPRAIPPITFDGAGRAYVLRFEPSGAVVDIEEGATKRTIAVGATDVGQIVPSRDGKRLLLHRSLGVDVFDVDTGKRSWAWASPQGIQAVAWSPDGASVAILEPTHTVGVVLDANDGSVLLRRCAGTFQARASLPVFMGFDSLTHIEPTGARPPSLAGTCEH